MLKYKHNTFKRKIKVYTKAFYKNKWYVKRNKLLDENTGARCVRKKKKKKKILYNTTRGRTHLLPFF